MLRLVPGIDWGHTLFPLLTDVVAHEELIIQAMLIMELLYKVGQPRFSPMPARPG